MQIVQAQQEQYLKNYFTKRNLSNKKHARTAGNVQSVTSLQGDGGTIEATQVVSGTVFASRHLDTCALVAFFFFFFKRILLEVGRTKTMRIHFWNSKILRRAGLQLAKVGTGPKRKH